MEITQIHPGRRLHGKIALLSDIHGNMGALEKVVEDMQARGIEQVFNLGDHVSGPLYPKETLDFLQKQDWIHTAGNHDRQMARDPLERQGLSNQYALRFMSDADLEWLHALPAVALVGGQFLLFHGAPASDTTYLLETVVHGSVRLASPAEIGFRLGSVTSPFMVCGHTHIPRVVETSQGGLVINPGSVGLQAYEDDTPAYHVIETGSPHARYAILEEKGGRWQVEIVTVDYDFQQAARQARKNGRPDWEAALQTGYALHSKDH